VPDPIAGFLDDRAAWRAAAGARAPAYQRLLAELARLLGDGTPEAADLADRLRAAWAGRAFQIFYDRPLLTLAALRMDALAEGPGHPLWPAVAAARPDPEAVRRSALVDAFARDGVWRSLRERFVQTNETSRALAWLWPAAIIGCGDGARPLELLEVGAAAGLNLVADRLPAPWIRAGGGPLPTARAPRTRTSLGIDAHPLDPLAGDGAGWLRACVWAGEEERLARLEAGIAAFREAPAQLVRGDVTDAPDRLRALSAAAPERAVVLAFQTIVRDYLPPETAAAWRRGMEGWLAGEPPGRALWIELEVDHDDPQKRVPIVAHLRDGAITLGVTGYHPTSVAVDDGAVERLARLCA
jgi:hypothetical protein